MRRTIIVRTYIVVVVSVLIAGLIVLVVGLLVTGRASFPGDDDSDDQVQMPEQIVEEDSGAVPVYGTGACPPSRGVAVPVLEFDGRQRLCINATRGYTAVFNTSEGTIRFSLDVGRVPVTVNNFVTLARWGYYDGSLLFRIDDEIDIIQGGAPHTNSWDDPGPGYVIPDEPGFAVDPDTGEPVGPYEYAAGQIVMARGVGFDSADAQFFFTAGPDAADIVNNGTSVVFGTTDDAGIAFLESLMELYTPSEDMGGVPSRPIVVQSIEIVESP